LTRNLFPSKILCEQIQLLCPCGNLSLNSARYSRLFYSLLHFPENDGLIVIFGGGHYSGWVLAFCAALTIIVSVSLEFILPCSQQLFIVSVSLEFILPCSQQLFCSSLFRHTQQIWRTHMINLIAFILTVHD